MAYATQGNSTERQLMPKLYIWFRPKGSDQIVETWEDLPGDWNDMDPEERSDECTELTRLFVEAHVELGNEVVESHGKRK